MVLSPIEFTSESLNESKSFNFPCSSVAAVFFGWWQSAFVDGDILANIESFPLRSIGVGLLSRWFMRGESEIWRFARKTNFLSDSIFQVFGYQSKA